MRRDSWSPAREDTELFIPMRDYEMEEIMKQKGMKTVIHPHEGL